MAYLSYGNMYPQYVVPMYPATPVIQPQQQVQQVQTAPQQQMQSGGFMAVSSEQEAREYPVAPGNVITFKIENQPYVCEKAQGFSQLESPVFNKYRLVKEDEPEPVNKSEPEFNAQDEIENLKHEIKVLKDKMYSKSKPLNNSSKGGDKE